MELAGGGATYHYRDMQSGTPQLDSHIDHLLEARRDESRQPDHVNLLLDGLADNLFGRHHDAHVDDLVVVTRHDHRHDVLPDVVDIALDSSQQHLAGFYRG